MMQTEENKQLREKVLAGWAESIPLKSIINYIVIHKIISLSDLEERADTPYKKSKLNDIKDMLKDREEEEYHKAINSNNPADKLIFIQMFPDSEYAQEMTNEIDAFDDSEWHSAYSLMTKESLERYKRLFSNGKYIAECNNLLDDIPYIEACRLDTIEGYLEYEKNHPSKHTEDIQNRIFNKKDDIAWETACRNNSRAAYKTYCENFPNGKYVSEAKKRMEYRNAKDVFLNDLLEDPNRFSVLEIQEKKQNGTIQDFNELKEIFSDKQIFAIENYKAPDILSSVEYKPPLNGYIEIYFWGLKGTGKTCAIGSIIGQLSRKATITPVPGSPGEPYLLQLQSLFGPQEQNNTYHNNSSSYYTDLPISTNNFDEHDIIRLPGSTIVGNLPVLTFEIRDEKKLSHKVSIIDVAGEVFSGLYKANHNNNMTDVEREAVNNLKSCLNNKSNYKIHFFIMEYGDNSAVNKEGILKSQIMSSLAEYFHREELFTKKSIGMYILATKCDRIPDGVNRQEAVNNYYKNSLWKNFVSGIKNIAEQARIKETGFSIICFSIGKVFAQDLCSFNPIDADKIIDKILTHTKGSKRGLFYKLFSWIDK